MPRSRSSSPKRPQVEPTTEPKESTVAQDSAVVDAVAPSVARKSITKEEFVKQVHTWLGEPKRWKDSTHSGVVQWGSFFRGVMNIVGQDELTYARFVVALAVEAKNHQYGAYELQFAVEPIINHSTDQENELSVNFWSELPNLIKKHKCNWSFWFELSDRCQTRQSFIRRDGDCYRLLYVNPVNGYNNRFHFGNGVDTTLDPFIAQIAESSQYARLNWPQKYDQDKECQNALQLATHNLLRVLPELIRYGPVTLPTLDGKNPLSEKIAAIAKKHDLKFDAEKNTFL